MTEKDYKGAKKVLVTGAAGFIGKNLCEYLLASGFIVRALVKEGGSAVLNFNRNMEQYSGDLLDREFLEKACEGVDFVVHLA